LENFRSGTFDSIKYKVISYEIDYNSIPSSLHEIYILSSICFARMDFLEQYHIAGET